MNITTDNFVNTQLALVLDLIDVQCLFELISENYEFYYHAENDECVNRLKFRIENGIKLKQKYLTILN